MNTISSYSSLCSNLLKLAASAFLIALTALTVNIVQSTLTPEFTINVNYMFPDPALGYGAEKTTTLTTPDPTAPVDYSFSTEGVPPGYVTPLPQQPTGVVPKK